MLRVSRIIRVAINDHDYDDEIGGGANASKTHGKFWGKAGAGILFVAEETGRVMVNKRSSHVNEPGTWGVWGGAMDEDEDPAEGAKREAEEETGYSGPIRLEQVYVFSNAGFKYTTFLGYIPKEFKPSLDWESAGFKWCNPGQWPTPMHFGLKSALSAIEAALESKV